MYKRHNQFSKESVIHRRGVASAEYILVVSTLCVGGGAIMLWSMDLMQSAYELIAGWVSWPFL
jgi:hypothetical protein